ncbi:MAG: HAD-IIB family hydrolase, partial [Pyrinomonadaceae bacterium]
MQANKIRLIALDLDGTLLNSKGEITPPNRRAIETARAQGILVALATGRRFRDARPMAIDLGLDLPLISHNGALTKHARSLETVSVKLLPLPEAREIIRLGHSLAADPMVSDDPEGLGTIVYDHVGEQNKALAAYLAWSKRVSDDIGQDAVRQVASLEEYLDHSPVHIAFSGSCEQMELVAAGISEALGMRVQI